MVEKAPALFASEEKATTTTRGWRGRGAKYTNFCRCTKLNCFPFLQAKKLLSLQGVCQKLQTCSLQRQYFAAATQAGLLATAKDIKSGGIHLQGRGSYKGSKHNSKSIV